MKKIVILGSSPSAVKAVQELRAADDESEIVMFAFDGFYPYRRELFFSFLSKEIPEDKLFYQPREFYENNRLQILLNRKPERINLKKRRLTTDQKEEVNFDILIITDTPEVKLPEIRGIGKGGVFGPRSLSTIKNMRQDLAWVDTVAVETTTPAGVRFAQAFKDYNKEVILITPSRHLLAEWLDESMAVILKRLLEAQGLQILCDNAIAEVLGDSWVKAVRLKTGKVLAAQMAVFSDRGADLKILCESGLESQEGLKVNDHLQTNMDHVYAMDDVASLRGDVRLSYPLSLLELEEQGRVVAKRIRGEENARFVPPPRSIRMTIGTVPVTLIGETLPGEGITEFFESDEAAQSYKKFFAKDHIRRGCVLINAKEAES